MVLSRFIILSLILIIGRLSACPQNVAQVCKCRLDGGALQVDCSQLSLAETVKRLEEANLPIKLLEMHDNNLIRDVPSKLFSKLKISQLDLSNNYVARIDPNAFVGQEESLTDLNLSNNSLNVVPNFALLKNLENLDLSGNTISDIRENVFAQNQQLRSLRVERNRICNLSPNALNETKQQLELLDMSSNCFSNVPASTLRGFQKLAYLDLGSNRITDVPNLQFMNMPGLRELRLNDNNINNVYPMSFMNVPNLELLNLARNKLPALDTNRFQSFDNLAVLDLTGNKLSKISTSAYNNMKSLRQLLLDDNNITTVETLAISSMPQLQLISMQNNNLKQLSRNSFDSLPSMQVLLMSGNQLQSLDPGMLSGMPALQQLNLHNNSISTVQPNTFDPLPQLTTLDLGTNRMQSLPVDSFKKLSKLFWLDLSQNRIKTLETGTFVTKVSNMLLQGNPWECDPKLDWFVRWLVASNVRTFLPGQPEVVCSGPPEYAGTLLKDLMIKKANETFFKTFGGAQGLFGNSLSNIPGLDFLSGMNGGSGAGGGDGSKVGSGIFDAIATPVNSMVGASLVTDLVRGLPGLIASFPSKNGPSVLPSGGAPTIDFSKVPPGVIQYVMNGGQIPGVSPETMQRLIQQYLQQLSRTLPAVNTSSPAAIIPPTTPLSGAKSSNGLKSVVITESMPLPPLSSLPPELVQSVMSGGLIPGMTKEQTESIKQRYMQQMFGGKDSSPSLPSNGSSSSDIALSTSNNGSVSLLGTLPMELLRGLNLSELAPQVLQDLANGRVPDLSKVPPELVQILINKRPDIFGQMVDKVLQNKIDAGSNSVLNKLPPTQQVPFQVTGVPYDVNELDSKADLMAQMKGNQNNLALWTGLGLGVVGVLTTATILYLCFKRRRARRSEENDGTKFFSTPRSSSANIVPVQNNNNLPPFFASQSSQNRSTLDYSKSDYTKVEYSKPDYSKVEYNKPDYSKQDYSKVDYGKPTESWMFASSSSPNFKKTEM